MQKFLKWRFLLLAVTKNGSEKATDAARTHQLPAE